MININTELDSIEDDVRGEDVRDSFVSACRKIATRLLPEVGEADIGKVLKVSDTGEWIADDL